MFWHDAVEPVFLDAHDLGVALPLAGRDVDAEIGQVGQHLLELAPVEHEAVGADRHRHAELVARPRGVDEHRRDRALAVGDETDALHADLGAVFEEIEHDFAIDGLAVVLLQHGVAVMAAVVAGAGQRHVDRDRRDPLAALPGADAVLVPGDLGAVQNKLGMIRHSGHGLIPRRQIRGGESCLRPSSLP